MSGALHCGGCNTLCAGGETCQDGTCLPDAPALDAGVDAGDSTELPCCEECEAGCSGCSATATPARDPGLPLVLLAFVLLAVVRRRP